MFSRRGILLYLSFFVIHHVPISIAEFQYSYCIPKSGKFTSNSTYQKNLNTLFSTLPSNPTDENGYFYTNFAGDNSSERVGAMVLCRGDVPDLQTCRTCIDDTVTSLKQKCDGNKEGLGGSDYCTMYYANKQLNNTVTEQPERALISGTDMANFTQFGSALKALLVRLRGEAASGGARMKFATGNTTAEGFNKTTYAMVQCTPDLTEKQCTDCLNLVIGEFPDCCTDQTGGRVVTPSCTFRYEEGWHFFSKALSLPKNNTNSPPPSPSAAAPPPGKRKNKKQTIIVVVVSVAASLLLLSTLILIILKRFSSKKNHLKRRRLRKSMKKIQVDDFSMVDDASAESLKFDFCTISNATNNFSDANMIGKGGFGVVYRGLLPSGQEIAVKRLSKNSVQGDKEFQTEVMLVAKLQHRNLVRLLGFCLEKEESLLIYEFVANSSLDNFLFDPIKRSDLIWETRFKIIRGISRGILYLHEDSRLRIIHRDLKASNVLLDEEMNPKISDFGTARLFVLDDETRGRTMRIVGTYGYMAPEYAMHGRFSVKSDVFSFGVLLLEIVSGQRNNCYQNGEHVEDLSSVAWISWKEGRAADVIDPALISSGGGGSIRDMIRCIHIGLLCVQENETKRPTMASVDVMISSSSMTLQAPSEPAFFMHSRMLPEEPLKGEECISAGNMDPITNLYAR